LSGLLTEYRKTMLVASFVTSGFQKQPFPIPKIYMHVQICTPYNTHQLLFGTMELGISVLMQTTSKIWHSKMDFNRLTAYENAVYSLIN
jgi:hypothetical protein